MLDYKNTWQITLFLTIFSVFCNKIYAQKSTGKIDSINRIIEKSFAEGNIDQKNILKNITDLYYLSHEAGLIQEQTKSVFLESGMYYYMNGDFESALVKINEGIDLATSQNDYNMLCRLSLLYQDLLLQLNYLNESRQVLKKCEEYNRLVISKNDQEVNTIFILLAKAESMVNNEGLRKDMNPVLAYKKKAYSQALKLSDSNKVKKFTVLFTLESLAWSTALSEKFDEARAYTVKTDQLLVSYPNENMIIQNLITKGAIENIAKNYKPALYYLSQVVDRAKKSNNNYVLYEVYPMISASHAQLGDFKKATIYSWQQKHIADSIDQVNTKEANISLINKINSKIADKKENNIFTTTNLSMIIIIFIVALGGFLLYRKKISKTKLDSQHDDAKVLPKEIEKPASANNESEITKKLVSLAKEDINTFYIEFQKMYPAFYHSLKEKYPDLNISDLNFCALMKMNFEIKQISVYTNSTIRSVESRRYRIIKKMELKSQDDLYISLSKLS